MSAREQAPHLAVVRGEPTAEELAALTAVLSARAAAARASDGAEQPAPVSGWRDRAQGLRGRVPHRPGPGAWRMSMR
ncbi:acyl-CoA carboxylase subunit epsilon [Nocardiopsis salina]|uniref:acyl-CoA carboxylase subunit epsilon n=1 Tax=Nocardiopsis salina TaxID=245836 RepID=UPI0003452066|nr:acyl-CoA carboxylase subunit epsilon [Nocardiopsis salina]